MNQLELKKGQLILRLYLEISRNPERNPKQIRDCLGIDKFRYHRYFSELTQIHPISYNRQAKRFEILSCADNKFNFYDPTEFYTLLLLLKHISGGKLKNSSQLTRRLLETPGVNPYLKTISKYLTFFDNGGANMDVAENLMIVGNAITARKKIIFTYEAKSKTVEGIKVSPYRIFYDKNWYFYGLSEYSGEPRNYKLSRMISPEITDEDFQMPDSIEINPMSCPWDIGGGEPVMITIEFDKSMARELKENVYHPSQKIETTESGNIRFSVEVKNFKNMIRWLISRVYSIIRINGPEEMEKEIYKYYNYIVGKRALHSKELSIWACRGRVMFSKLFRA